MRRAIAGDDEAFTALVTRHRTAALRVATVVLGTAEGADDVVQQATERAWRAVGTVDPTRPFQAWFFRIVVNAARNQQRTLGRQAHLALRVGGRRPAVEQGPEDAVVTESERRRVIDAMNRLGSDDRLVIALRHFEQLSELEMAQSLDCPAGTIKSRLSRAMTRLRHELTVEEATP